VSAIDFYRSASIPPHLYGLTGHPYKEARAELGGLIGKDNDVSGAPLVAVLTHVYWQRAFGTSND
jgi:hypothetical protein